MVSAKIVPIRRNGLKHGPIELRNRVDQQIVGNLIGDLSAPQLAIIVHGFGGSQRQPQMVNAAKTFADHDFPVLTFDATNSFGGSGGDIRNASLTNHFRDLEDVVVWLRNSCAYKGNLVMCGFSLGASAALKYSLKHKNEVSAIVAIAPVVSGREWLRSFEANRPGSYEILLRTGFFPKYNEYTGESTNVPQAFVDDLLEYDFIKSARYLNGQYIIAVGDADLTCERKSVESLADALGKHARFSVIKGLSHTARKPQELKNLKRFLDSLFLSVDGNASTGSLAVLNASA